MKIVSLGPTDKFIVMMSVRELEVLSGFKIEMKDSYYSREGKKQESLLGQEISIDKWHETVATAEAVVYKAKQSVQAIESFKKKLEEATFPFIETFQGEK